MIAPSAREAPYAFGASVGHGANNDAELALLERTRAYLAAIECSTDPDVQQTGSALEFYHPSVQQEELPNRFTPDGAVRDLAAITDAAMRGRKVLQSQRYAVRSILVQGQRVAVETLWVGVLAIGVGTLAPGGEMRAHFGMFLEFEGDRIKSQRNYDCFEQF